MNDSPSSPRRGLPGRVWRAARVDPGPLLSGCGDPWADPRDGGRRRLGWALLSTGGVFAILLSPAVVGLVAHPPGGLLLGGMLLAAGALAVLFIRLFAVLGDADGGGRARPRLELAGFVVLAVGLATRGVAWTPALALATLVVGLHTPPVLTGVVVTALSCLAGVLGWLGGHDPTGAVTLMLAAGIMGGFGYLRRRSTQMSAQLRATQQELAGMAVAEERLRIARELHDLLGHSLSVIALKAELAGSLLPADPDGARGEIGEVEAVARRSLGEVREAVTGYRRPTLAAELASARHSIATAGIACRVEAPADGALPADVDGLLAWTVREGATNVIRHSRASTCTLRLLVDGQTASVEVIDDGVGPVAGSGTGSDGRSGSTAASSGLAGLAERAGWLGGQLDAGAAGERGFRLRVGVPLERSR